MPRRRSRLAIVTLVVVLALGVAGYAAFQHSPGHGSGCTAGGNLSLQPGQAAIAATIAGVAHQRRLPAHAVTIAYATAMQESHLRDLSYGDLDSVGVFQQRPSEGWGSPQQLIDPVYATEKFFAALVKVPGYLHLPVPTAAQDVQRSADGSAYGNYVTEATVMAGSFAGTRPHAVWCWLASSPGQPRITALSGQLRRTFGQLTVRAAGQGASVRVIHPASGWAVASWVVTHASAYGISNVRYGGYQWNAGQGGKGWTRIGSATFNRVELR